MGLEQLNTAAQIADTLNTHWVSIEQFCQKVDAALTVYRETHDGSVFAELSDDGLVLDDETQIRILKSLTVIPTEERSTIARTLGLLAQNVEPKYDQALLDNKEKQSAQTMTVLLVLQGFRVFLNESFDVLNK